MSAGNWFWIIFFLLGLAGGGAGCYRTWAAGHRWATPAYLILLVLVGLVGWKVFGPPIN